MYNTSTTSSYGKELVIQKSIILRRGLVRYRQVLSLLRFILLLTQTDQFVDKHNDLRVYN